MICTNDCSGEGKIKAVVFIKTSDINPKTGKVKRKYGRFNREIVKLNVLPDGTLEDKNNNDRYVQTF